MTFPGAVLTVTNGVTSAYKTVAAGETVAIPANGYVLYSSTKVISTNYYQVPEMGRTVTLEPYLFTPDAEVIRHGVLYLRTYSIDCILVTFVFTLNGFYAGCGRTGRACRRSVRRRSGGYSVQRFRRDRHAAGIFGEGASGPDRRIRHHRHPDQRRLLSP